MNSKRPLRIVFFRNDNGNEPVRDWLLKLHKEERKMIGADILAVQYAWPVGKPLVDNLTSGIWEIRSKLKDRIARTLFCVVEEEIVLLHGFIKETRRTPIQEIDLAKKRKGNTSGIMKNRKSSHRGSDFREFLDEDGILDEVESLALKKAIAIQMQRILKEKALSKTDMAKRMKTSRAAVDRLLDETNRSVTLSTLEKGAKAVGHKLKLELIPG